MPNRPEVFPKWAASDEIDPISGQNNIVEPPDERKESGWKRREIPPRQWENWLARLSWQWIRWARDRIDALTSTVGGLSATVDDVVSQTEENTATIENSTTSPVAWFLARRTEDGTLKAQDPDEPDDLTTKSFVEEIKTSLLGTYYSNPVYIDLLTVGTSADHVSPYEKEIVAADFAGISSNAKMLLVHVGVNSEMAAHGRVGIRSGGGGGWRWLHGTYREIEGENEPVEYTFNGGVACLSWCEVNEGKVELRVETDGENMTVDVAVIAEIT